MIRTVIESYVGLYFAVGDKKHHDPAAAKMLFGARTEKTSAVIVAKKNASLSPVPDAAAPPATSPGGQRNHVGRAGDGETWSSQPSAATGLTLTRRRED